MTQWLIKKAFETPARDLVPLLPDQARPRERLEGGGRFEYSHQGNHFSIRRV